MQLTKTALVIAVVMVVAGFAHGAQARPSYPGLLPNGTAIDSRGCINCHTSAQGGGSRNSFGNAMSNSGLDWASVCNSDSDGDGQTNGQELGDPDCVWSGSGPAARTTAISNPGKASSTSSDPTGGFVQTGEGEGEGSAGEGEGEGEGQSGGTVHEQCPAHASASGLGCVCGTGFVANTAGNACVASTGSTWKCDPTWLGDGSCDCGCGAHDTDCADNTMASCQYNDCDSWQPSPGLQIESSDPTQCAGGVSAGGTTTVSGQCPASSTAAANECVCNAGFAPDASDASCVAVSSCPVHSSSVNDSCHCDNGYVVDAAGTSCVPAAGEGEGEGQVVGGEGEGQGGEGEGEGQRDGEGEGAGAGAIPDAPIPLSCANTTDMTPFGVVALLAVKLRRRRAALPSRI